MEKINEEVAKAKKEFGVSNGGYVFTQSAHQGYHERIWQCACVKMLSSNKAVSGYIKYDFEDLPEYEDAVDFAWEDAARQRFVQDQNYDLTDKDEAALFLTLFS